MSKSKFSKNIHLYFLFTFLIVFAIESNAQEITEIKGDTASNAIETLKLSEISKKSAEVFLQAQNILKESVDDAEIKSLSNKTKANNQLIDSLLKRESFVKLRNLSTRNLTSKLTYWNKNLNTIEAHQSLLTNLFMKMNDNRNNLEQELEKWELTIKKVKGEKLKEAVSDHFEKVKIAVDTTNKILDEKSTRILAQLDETNLSTVKIKTLLPKIEDVIQEKQKHFFDTNQLDFYNLLFLETIDWKIPTSFLNYFKGNYIYFRNYMWQHMANLFVNLLFMVLLIFLFIRLNKLELNKKDKVWNAQIVQMKELISNPINMAIIIGAFSSVLIFPYRTLMFIDITRILVILPIIVILRHILPNKYRVYIYIYGILTFLNIVLINMPSNHILSRFLLLFISLVKIITIVHFLANHKKGRHKDLKYSRNVLAVLYIFLIMSLAGLFANIVGKVNFAALFAEALLSLIMIGILIYFSLTVANGLIVLLIDGPLGDKLNIIKNNKKEAIKKLIRFFNFSAVILFIYYLLRIFELSISLVNWSTEFMTAERHIGKIVFSWGNILVFFLVIYISILMSSLIRSFLEDDVLKKMKLKKGLPYTIGLVVKYSLITLGIFIAVSAAGIPMSQFAIIFGAFGVGIGFGLQNIFNNLVSGLILLFERPIKIGDTIEFGTLLGNVKSIGIRASNVRTFDGAEIIVPNGNLISSEVINWTLSDQHRRIEIIVGVSYSADPDQTQELLFNVLKQHPNVVDEPAPSVLFQNLGESSLDFRVLAWTADFDQWVRIKSELIFKIFYSLKEAGIEIPFPQRDLHLRSMDESISLNDVTTSKDEAKKDNKQKVSRKPKVGQPELKESNKPIDSSKLSDKTK
jgi:potassium efflux system protein